jgi:HlyD family secretion protein
VLFRSPITAPYRGKLIYLPDTGTLLEEGDQVMVMEDEEAVEELDEYMSELKTVKSELEASIESLNIAMRSNSLNLDSAESELEYSRIRLQDVNLQMAETEVLLQQSVVPEDDLRSARSQMIRSRLSTMSTDLDFQSQETTTQTEMANNMSSIQQSKLQGEKLQREIKEAKQEIEEATIYAPVAGLFQRSRRWDWRQQKMVEPKQGDDLRRGQVIGEIPDLETLIVRSQIPEVYFTQVENGAKVNVNFDAFEGFETTGTVAKVGKVAIDRQASPGGSLAQSNSKSKEKVFEIEIELDEPPKDLKPGISANVSIVLSQTPNVLAVPIDAIQREGDNLFVRVQESNSRITRKEVEVGKTNNNSEVIVKSGLQAGDRLFIPDRSS